MRKPKGVKAHPPHRPKGLPMKMPNMSMKGHSTGGRPIGHEMDQHEEMADRMANKGNLFGRGGPMAGPGPSEIDAEPGMGVGGGAAAGPPGGGPGGPMPGPDHGEAEDFV